MFHRTYSSVDNRRRPAGAGWSRRVAIAATGLIVWTATSAASAQAVIDYADLAEKVTPAVVNISSTQQAKPSEAQPMPFSAPPGSPMEELMRRFWEQMPQQRGGGQPSTALGSGFIIDAEGHIVTNNHVIDGADKVSVKLSDGRSYDATIVGTDPQTDIALLKVTAEKPLPHVAFGESEKLRVGQAVLAVGNPFGLGGTVTSGIVSARGRDIHAGPYDDFIQTDAAINRGNSGGPMFNQDGQVVGVNSAIYSPNGGSVGIGFAIPSDMVKQVVADLKQSGRVERGWLGVSIQPVTDEIAAALGMDKAQGALVSSVSADS
ncbi:MAG: trypsin-like peptidase domain-containing protein, partial [Alphaproteobacteria bacterium]|nr:trypsin-like peptidase domain-containing protein [Alphaproteobacteria bacterium]